MQKDDMEILRERCANWREVYKTGMRFHKVAWYAAPDAGDVLLESHEQFVRLPFNVQDAVRLEFCWVRLNDQAKKFFLKSVYVQRMNCNLVARKMKQFDLRLYSSENFNSFDRLSLEYFQRRLDTARFEQSLQLRRVATA